MSLPSVPVRLSLPEVGPAGGGGMDGSEIEREYSALGVKPCTVKKKTPLEGAVKLVVYPVAASDEKPKTGITVLRPSVKNTLPLLNGVMPLDTREISYVSPARRLSAIVS